MIATGFPAISPSNRPRKEAADYRDGRWGGKVANGGIHGAVAGKSPKVRRIRRPRLGSRSTRRGRRLTNAISASERSFAYCCAAHGGGLYAPRQRAASIRSSRRDSRGRAALLCAFGLSRRLDAGHLRRGRDEPGQPLPLLPLEGGADRRHRGTRPRRDRAAVRQCRSVAGTVRRARRPGASPLRGAAEGRGAALHRGDGGGAPASRDRPHLARVRRRCPQVADRSPA